MKKNLSNCKTKVDENNVEVLASTARGEGYLMTLEALWIRELNPGINTKDEYRGRTLSIKI